MLPHPDVVRVSLMRACYRIASGTGEGPKFAASDQPEPGRSNGDAW